jgi:hypothetical protein
MKIAILRLDPAGAVLTIYFINLPWKSTKAGRVSMFFKVSDEPGRTIAVVAPRCDNGAFPLPEAPR